MMAVHISREEKSMSCENDEDDKEFSPPEFLKMHCFPLRDYELIKVYDFHIQVIDQLKLINEALDRSDDLNNKDDDELQKIKKRATEFSNRFARNYTYTLQLYLTNLQKFIKSGKAVNRKNSELLKKMLIAVYLTAVQAAQAYVSYITPIGRIHPKEKLRSFLIVIKDMYETCRTILIPIMDSIGHGTGDMLADVCDAMLGKLLVEQKKIAGKVKGKKLKENVNVKPTVLSMYEGKLGTWKKKADTIAKLKQDRGKRVVRIQKTPRGELPIAASVTKLTRSDSEKLVPREVKSGDGDVPTEIQRFALHDAKTQEDICVKVKEGKKSHKSSKLRSALLEALRYVDNGDEAAALEKLKALSMEERNNIQYEKETILPNNVQLLYVKSQSMEELNKLFPDNKKDIITSNEMEIKDKKTCETVSKRKSERDALESPIGDKVLAHKEQVAALKNNDIPLPIDVIQEGMRQKGKEIEMQPSSSMSRRSNHSNADTKRSSSARSTKQQEGKLQSIFNKKEIDLSQLIPLKVPPQVHDKCMSYKLIMEKTEQPAQIVSRVSDKLVKDLVTEVLEELVDDKYLHHIYQYELQAI